MRNAIHDRFSDIIVFVLTAELERHVLRLIVVCLVLRLPVAHDLLLIKGTIIKSFYYSSYHDMGQRLTFCQETDSCLQNFI